MPNVQLTDDQKAKLGAEVAQVKTLLNEVENKISNNDVNSVDWQNVSARLRSLDGKVNELSGNVVTRESLPPPANPDGPTEGTVPSSQPPEGAGLRSPAVDQDAALPDDEDDEDYETGPPPPPFGSKR